MTIVNAAEIRSATVGVMAQAQVVVRLPDGQIAEVVGYTKERGVVVLETVLPEDG